MMQFPMAPPTTLFDRSDPKKKKKKTKKKKKRKATTTKNKCWSDGRGDASKGICKALALCQGETIEDARENKCLIIQNGLNKEKEVKLHSWNQWVYTQFGNSSYGRLFMEYVAATREVKS